MSNAALEAAIDAAWEARAEITPSTGGENPRGHRGHPRSARTAAACGSPTLGTGPGMSNQWAKKAVLLGFRHQGHWKFMLGRVRQFPGGLVGQGRLEVSGAGWRNSYSSCARRRVSSGAVADPFGVF